MRKHVAIAALAGVAIFSGFAAWQTTGQSKEVRDAVIDQSPFAYTVTLKFREVVDGTWRELSSISLPVAKAGEPASIKLTSGGLTFSAIAVVRYENSSAILNLKSSTSYKGVEDDANEFEVVGGHTCRIGIGETEHGLTLEAILTAN